MKNLTNVLLAVMLFVGMMVMAIPHVRVRKSRITMLVGALLIAMLSLFMPANVQTVAAQGPGETEEFQAIPTNGAEDWEYFTIGSDSYLAMANYYGDISKIYKWNGTSFDEFQSIATNGAVDWEYFTIGSDTYLAVANLWGSAYYEIYKWNGASFVEFQTIAISGVRDWEHFTIGNDTYLAMGNYYINDHDAKIFKWNGSSFVEVQSIDSPNRAVDWEYFTIGKSEHISHFLESLKLAKTYFPEFANYQIIGAVSSFQIDSSLIKYASRQGLVVLALGDGLMTIQNKPGFQWKPF